MITLVEKKPLIFKLRMELSKFMVNRKIKYASKRGLSYIEILVPNNAVRKELVKYYESQNFVVWKGFNNIKIQWKVVKE